MTDYVHPATGETGVRGEQARQAEEYFTSLPRRRFSIESLNAITYQSRLADFYCGPCMVGDHAACRGYPDHHGRVWREDANGDRRLVYAEGASKTPWEKNGTMGDGRWAMYGQVFTETLCCQCAAHDHPALHPMFEGKCMISLRDDWGSGGLCGKPAKGTTLRDGFGGASTSTGFEVAACGLHMSVAKRKAANREKWDAEWRAQDEAAAKAKADYKAAKEWAVVLTELTGIQFTASWANGLTVDVPPEPLYAVLDRADIELRGTTGMGLKELGEL